ncbi:hypothetical protein PoB_002582300 [Plakobranchus ocellatus]|uniref:Uncharacterized protein n=1 Tax=Plakobranchus ocellatus TaxID=259542 RepID=A0AAV3ZWT5_9GAST|nr:hypothetical protein PoB_002582300 [Plakobranchus ocellatus]
MFNSDLCMTIQNQKHTRHSGKDKTTKDATFNNFSVSASQWKTLAQGVLIRRRKKKKMLRILKQNTPHAPCIVGSRRLLQVAGEPDVVLLLKQALGFPGSSSVWMFQGFPLVLPTTR